MIALGIEAFVLKARRSDALEIERISSERRRGLSIAVGKKVHTFNFPNVEHRYVP